MHERVSGRAAVSEVENLQQGRLAPAVRRGQALVQRLRTGLWPALQQGGCRAYAFLRGRVVPATCHGARCMCREAVTIYRSHNWLQRCGSTLNKKAIGLGIAMLSAKMVSQMVETRQVTNLWGLLADRPVVSETTFTVLIFTVEYVVALLVFALIDHYVAAYQRRRAARNAA